MRLFDGIESKVRIFMFNGVVPNLNSVIYKMSHKIKSLKKVKKLLGLCLKVTTIVSTQN